MRTPLTLALLVSMALAAIVSAVHAAPAPTGAHDVTVTFRHRTAEGVRYEVRFEKDATGARYEAYLAEGEHITERSGHIDTAAFRALVSSAQGLIGPNAPPAVSESDACYEMTLQRAGAEQTARCSTPAGPRDTRLVAAFGPKALPGIVYKKLLSRDGSP